MKLENQQQEHTGSYYAASVNEHTSYPQLSDSHEVDVCVVGAGFTGVATALTLAERGFSVALLEANRVGWGASGRNGGQLINGISGSAKVNKANGGNYDDLLWDLGWRGNTIIRERIEKYGIQCDFKEGFVEVAVKPKQVPWLEEYAEEREARNFPHRWEIWSREETRDKLGTDAYHGAFACFRDGHLHPLNLCIGEAKAAAGLGVKIFEQSPVTHIDHGDRPVVHTAKGQIKASAVVLAGNAYGQLEPKHLSNLVFPAGSYIIATEPLSDDMVAEINREDVAVCDVNNVVDYYRLSGDRRLLYGGACNYSGRDPRDIEAYIRPRMERVYPQMKDVRIEYQWGGKIGIVLNRVPAVGRVNGNVYYCQGYSGHGVNATHVMGEVMADAIGGTLETFDLFANVGHFRIPGTRWLGNQIIALGMLYYKMKDKI